MIEGGTAPAYVESGHLVYLRGTSILAVPFDLARLAVTGTPMAVVEGVQSQSLTYGAPTFTVARAGTLVYWPHQGNAQRLVVVDRAGRARPLSPFVEGPLVEPRLSPDGGAIALRRSGANDQVWRFDIERESFSQVTFEWDNITPVWTPDGASLIVTSSPGWKLHRMRADGSGTAERLRVAGAAGQFPGSVSAGFLAYREVGKASREDIWVAPLEAGGEPRAFVQTPAREWLPAFSPSGRSLAYESDESGQDEIYLRPFPGGTSKAKVSTGGGIEPVWARSGKELFYRLPLEGSKARMMVVDVSEGPPIHLSPARGLFEDSHHIGGGNTPGYDVFPDGQHFVMVEDDPGARRVTHAKVVLNWLEGLKRLVPSR